MISFPIRMYLRFCLATVAFALLCGCTGEPARPHIVLVSIDTLRWDYLGAYGYKEPHISPTINWLAENGTVFEQAVASAGTTVPSHGTMLTGLYPRQHGARSNHHGLYPETDTIARALSDAGYRTGAFTSVNFISKIGKLNRGFQSDNLPFEKEDGQFRPLSGTETLAQVDHWLNSIAPGQPVFLFLHLWETHAPFEPSEWATARMADYEDFLKDGFSVEHLRQWGDDIKQSPEHLAALRALYSGEVNRVDRILGEFFEDWESRGLLDNSVILFTADHGEGLGEGNHIGHGATHNEYVIRVPLILTDFRSPRHRRIDTRVGIIDIAPTLADIAGLEPQFDWFGHSLLDQESLKPDRPYFAEVELRTRRKRPKLRDDSWYDPNAVGVWAGDLKLVSRLDSYSLLETYPDNRPPSPVDPQAEAIMFNYLSGLIDSFREVEIDFTEADLPDDVLRQLQGLGYVQ